MDSEYERLLRNAPRARIIERMSPLLESFLREHSLGTPAHIFHSALDHCAPKNCFQNVEEQVKRMGGSALSGWIFWEYEDILLHAEAHCVWVGPQGSQVDITPHAVRVRRPLFLPDERVAEKRGYTPTFETIYSKNPKEVAMLRFYWGLSALVNREFKGMGQAIELKMSEVKEMADGLGLPDDVAAALYRSFTTANGKLSSIPVT
jgi:hypothetical protein